jgi:transposase
MVQLTPQSRIWLALAPVDFRKGIDGLAAVCRQTVAQNPLDGAIYVFRNRTGTTLKRLCYDGQGYWLSRRLHNASLCNCSGRGSVARTAVRFSGE